METEKDNMAVEKFKLAQMLANRSYRAQFTNIDLDSEEKCIAYAQRLTRIFRELPPYR